MLFLNKEGNVTESWASSDRVYFAKMDLSQTTQLQAVAMVEQVFDEQGQVQMVNKHVLYDTQRAMQLVSLPFFASLIKQSDEDTHVRPSHLGEDAKVDGAIR